MPVFQLSVVPPDRWQISDVKIIVEQRLCETDSILIAASNGSK